jgi:hypothetical protein
MSKRKETVSVLSLNIVVFIMGRCIFRKRKGITCSSPSGMSGTE